MPIVNDDLPFDLPWAEGRTPAEFSARAFGAGAASPAERAAGLVMVPFRGVRYAAASVDLAAVTSPPYDLIDDEAVRRLLATDPHNIVRLILPVGDPAGRYAQARDTLRFWRSAGTLATDPDPSLYVYEQTGRDVVQRGLIGAVGLRTEAAGVVLPHEDVFPGPVRDRLRLMGTTGANLEPIFLVYEGGGTASQIVDATATTERPVVEIATDDGLTHRLWRIAKPDVHADIAADLRERQALIADGHHRYATYRALQAWHHTAGHGPGPWDYGMALLVDSAHYPPRLGAIHRVLPDLPLAVAVERAKSAFRVTEVSGPLPTALDALEGGADPAFLVGDAARMYLLTDPDPVALARAMPSGRSERWRRLDTAVLDQLLIGHVWGITEDEYTVEIVHHDAAAALSRAARSSGTAVVMNPLLVADVLAVAAGGERVPRKSTSFGPKPRTGVVLRLFDAEPTIR
ncbi:MAG TPA: DUF1015 domain-containing protein [Streptosporangiaceae bacterium]|nr:DUF1015 domain-containing protein [Streptosporangiaceae bacterium]